MFAQIRATAAHFPKGKLTNEMLSEQFPAWSVEKIAAKTGIENRYIASTHEYSSTLATEAAKKLFEIAEIEKDQVDYVILVTQSPDFQLPSTACIVQDNLELSNAIGAIDVNMGCSGFVYGLGIAKGVIESGQAKNVLLITADTYSKYINQDDKSVRTIFGDGATATWISDGGTPTSIGSFVYGTDGSGAKNLILANGNLRDATKLSEKAAARIRGLTQGPYDIYMDGPEIFTFTLRVAEDTLAETLKKAGKSEVEIDKYIFHQANAFMLETLRDKLKIPENKFPIVMKNWGNTVSSTIPMAIAELAKSRDLPNELTAVLMGFGVGLSWASVVVEIKELTSSI